MENSTFFSPEQRLEIYKDCLNLLNENKYYTSFCRLAKFAIEKNKRLYYCPPYIIGKLPELLAKKPKITYSSVFWFEPYNWKERRQILIEVINEMQQNETSR